MMNVIKPEELRQATEYTLHGLTADDSLKFRILEKAASSSASPGRASLHPVPVLCSVLAVLLIAVLGLNSLHPASSVEPVMFNSFSAGYSDSALPLFPDGFNPDAVVCVELSGFGRVSDSGQCNALSGILASRAVPADSGNLSSGGILSFTDQSGNTAAFDASAPYLSGENGQCWRCPEFFTMFEQLSE